jgi:hypothetical protein
LTNAIARNNKDLISKILADTFGEKSFEVYGIHLPPIVQCLPTEFPDVQVTDRVSDRLFLLQDGSYALVDFESQYLLMNKVKYLRYITRVLDHYLRDTRDFHLRFIVLYMGNVRSARPDYSTDCLTIRTEQAFLSHIDGDREFEKIRTKLDKGESLTDEDLMKLIILPLTYNKRETQISMIDKAVDSAIRIKDEEKRSFVLAGLCIATDKFIRDDQINRIGGILRMTKVGQYLQEEYEKIERRLKEKEERINEKQARIDEKQARIDEKQAMIDEKQARIDEKQAMIDEKQAMIDEKQAMIDEYWQQVEQDKQRVEQDKQRVEQNKREQQQIKQELQQYKESRRKTIENLLREGILPEKVNRITGAELKEIETIQKALF